MKNLVATPNDTKPFGTLYHKDMGKTHGSVVITPRKLTKRSHVTRTIGAGITSMVMALYIYSFGPISQSQFAQIGVTPQVQTSSVQIAQASDEVSPEAAVSSQFSIYIPFLRSKSVVIPNINAFDESEYKDALSQGVAQAKGTGLPGEGTRIFLFAHSTNSILNIAAYNAIFYDLGKIPNGETIELYYEGKVHQYRVTGQKIVEASDVSWLSPQDGEELILQTCYPPGTSWKRLLLFANPI